MQSGRGEPGSYSPVFLKKTNPEKNADNQWESHHLKTFSTAAEMLNLKRS
ncbi:hypothetical protein GCM10020331_070810 [Ectobacillus funiculus]